MDNENKNQESFNVKGSELLKKVEELLREGSIRKISIMDKNGKTLAEFPLTIGVVGALVAPSLAAIGAIAALVSDCTIKIERDETAG